MTVTFLPKLSKTNFMARLEPTLSGSGEGWQHNKIDFAFFISAFISAKTVGENADFFIAILWHKIGFLSMCYDIRIWRSLDIPTKNWSK